MRIQSRNNRLGDQFMYVAIPPGSRHRIHSEMSPSGELRWFWPRHPDGAQPLDSGDDGGFVISTIWPLRGGATADTLQCSAGASSSMVGSMRGE